MDQMDQIYLRMDRGRGQPGVFDPRVWRPHEWHIILSKTLSKTGGLKGKGMEGKGEIYQQISEFQKDHQDHLDPLDRPDHQDHMDTQAHQDLQGTMDLQDHLGHRDHRDHLDLQEKKDPQDHRDQQEEGEEYKLQMKDNRNAMPLPENPNWKFKNLNHLMEQTALRGEHSSQTVITCLLPNLRSTAPLNHRYYQNLVEWELSQPGLYVPAIHEWPDFILTFGKLFGLHDEQLHSQATLDSTIQKLGESFADFFVHFEDASLKTRYNDDALRWRLLKQIRRDLRNHLTMVGRIPDTYPGVIERLLDLDGAREAFQDAGPGPQTQYNRNRGAQPSPAPANSLNQAQARAAFAISQEERDRRMRERLCLICGEPGETPTEDPAHARASFTYNDDEEVDMQLFFETEEETPDEQTSDMGKDKLT
ncbi:hypothetical protein BT96DRAFT_947091 [Gymnopus androsaceus JB14]|uniref:Retrotransposon gag domain-containing protein n=1 Tax=Gymnopus androsaceus JB14 TaxID=1447944 RepID=A0A6A4GTL2_9AGAR|nr:hypothetical protein BT96DRAFT_947091 [Gymnopus androsaceus JB14]